MTDPIYHLAEPKDWAASTDEYTAPSLDDEGFIHCSTIDQLSGTARQIFDGRNNLVLLTVDSRALGDLVVYEDLYDSREEFPHVYGPIPTGAVLATGPYLTHLEEGLWLHSRFDRDWMERVLHPDFTGVGRSARRYTREEALNLEPYELSVELPLDQYRMNLIDEDVALVRYISKVISDGAVQTAERTSVWINTNEGWRLCFHQGTQLP